MAARIHCTVLLQGTDVGVVPLGAPSWRHPPSRRYPPPHLTFPRDAGACGLLGAALLPHAAPVPLRIQETPPARLTAGSALLKPPSSQHTPTPRLRCTEGHIELQLLSL
jgi:hypothetical protein